MPTASTSSPDPLLETQVFWTQYKRPILIGLAVILLGLAAYGAFRLYIERRDAAAAALLSSAKAPADYQKIIADYPSTGAAGTAYLFLASQQRENKQFPEANATLQKFISAYPKHELVTTAKMAMAGNQESLGKADEALETYRKIAADHPKSFNAPLAMLGQVQILKAKGQVDEARRVCETVLTQYRESYAAMEATRYLKSLKPKADAEAVAAPVPAPTTETAASPVVAPSVAAQESLPQASASAKP